MFVSCSPVCYWPTVFGPESRSLSFLQLFISSYDLLWLQSVTVCVPNKRLIETGQDSKGRYQHITTIFSLSYDFQIWPKIWIILLGVVLFFSTKMQSSRCSLPLYSPQDKKLNPCSNCCIWSSISLHMLLTFFRNERHREMRVEWTHFFELSSISTGLCRQWLMVSTSAHNLKHQISPPVQATFAFFQWGPNFERAWH